MAEEIKTSDIISSKVADSYTIKDNTFILPEKGSSKIQAEVGDIKQLDFKPQVKIKNWENETNFSVRLKDDSEDVAEIKTEDNKIKYVKEKIEAHFYERDDTDDEDGAYELEVLLKEKPVSNVLEFTIETKELDFFYQPALTQEEIDEGAERPENVVGSYAVYHKSKRDNIVGGKEYKTGKAFHIYRPHIKDDKGNECWGELNFDIEKKLLTVTIPQDFLDTAVYPVLVDPTFGYTSIGSTSTSLALKILFFKVTSPSENGNITNITTYGRGGTASDFGNAIYSDNSNFPGSKLAEDSGNTTLGTSNSWVSTSLSYSFSSNTSYWLGAWPDLSPALWFGAYDSGGSTGQYVRDDEHYGDFENWPEPPTSGFSSDRLVSIYATYTASSSDTYTLTATKGAFTLTGKATTLETSRKLTASAGSITLSGYSTGLSYSKVYSLTANTGTFTLTGYSTDLTYIKVYNLIADTGTFSLTGYSTGLNYSEIFRLSADTGTFMTTGYSAGLSYSRAYSLTASVGSFTLTGISATLTKTSSGITPETAYRVRAYAINSEGISYGDTVDVTTIGDGYILVTETGDFTLTGEDAELTATRKLTAGTVSFVLTGNDINTGVGYSLDAETGAFTLTGIDINYGRNYIINPETGAFALTGFEVALIIPRRWTNEIKNTATFSNETRNTSTWTNESKS